MQIGVITFGPGINAITAINEVRKAGHKLVFVKSKSGHSYAEIWSK